MASHIEPPFPQLIIFPPPRMDVTIKSPARSIFSKFSVVLNAARTAAASEKWSAICKVRMTVNFLSKLNISVDMRIYAILLIFENRVNPVKFDYA
jgi:hypothetical protein